MRETKAKADVESVAALDRIERAARETVDIGWTFDPHIAQDFATVREALTTRAAAPTMYEALRRAERFVRNGIEYGYIRMPDADTPDSAHEVPEIVRAALATATPSPKASPESTED